MEARKYFLKKKDNNNGILQVNAMVEYAFDAQLISHIERIYRNYRLLQFLWGLLYVSVTSRNYIYQLQGKMMLMF